MPENITAIPAKIIMGWHKLEYVCDECEGNVVSTGTVFTVNPPLYEHKCEGCGTMYKFRKVYPSADSLWR